jgi:AraC-like DNA-binding protein
MVQQREKGIPSYSLEEASIYASSMIEIIDSHGAFVNRKANFLVPHRKNFYLLVFVREGSSRHWVDFVPYTLKPNTFYFSTPPQIHVKEKSVPMNGILLSFTEEFLQIEENSMLRSLPLIQNPDNQHALDLTDEQAVFIEDLMNKMVSEFNSSQAWKKAMLQSYLRVLLFYTSRLYEVQYPSEGSYSRMLLKKFRALIETHFTTMHQVSDYASLMQITPGHLGDVVKEQSGKSAIEHIHERILLEAKRNLLHSDLTMKEIAHALGFEDAAYFNRFFKRLAGETPASYRITIREMYQ